MGRETYFPHLAILVPERQSCACLRGKKYTLRKIITRHSDHVPRLNLHSPAAPPVPHFPRFRALALFGRRPPQRVDSLVMPASENLVWGLLVSRREWRCCRVILSRHQIAFAAWTALCSAAPSGQAPKPLAARRRRGA